MQRYGEFELPEGLFGIMHWLDDRMVSEYFAEGKALYIEQIQKETDAKKIEELASKIRALYLKELHIYNAANIAQQIIKEHIAISPALLYFATMFHDTGRVLQMQLIGNFNDRELDHNSLGLGDLDRFIMLNNVSITPEIQILRDVIYYHGRVGLARFVLPDISRVFVEVVSDADDIENGCFGAIGYLLDEWKNDTKGYNKQFPEMIGKIKRPNPNDPTDDTPDLFAFYERGEWFDKMRYCQSYAEYVLFAATLAMKSLKKYGTIARNAMQKPSYGYSSAVEGYKYIFSQVMSPEDAERASKILEDEVNKNDTKIGY